LGIRSAKIFSHGWLEKQELKEMGDGRPFLFKPKEQHKLKYVDGQHA
jgi:hypothetical protein